MTFQTLVADLRERYARWEKCCAWVDARVTPNAPLTPEGLCPYTAIPDYSVEEIRRRDAELGPMVLEILEDAERLGVSVEELNGAARPGLTAGEGE